MLSVDPCKVKPDNNLQVRIQDLVKGRPSFLRSEVADVAKPSRVSEVSNLWPGPGPA